MMESNLLQRITFNPAQCGGKPCIRGMRIRVSDILQLLGNGFTSDIILEEFPDITKEDIQAFMRLLQLHDSFYLPHKVNKLITQSLKNTLVDKWTLITELLNDSDLVELAE